jgi:hypothetical protein
MLISNYLECASWRDERRQLDDLRLLGLPAGVQLVAEGEGRHQLSVELVACVEMYINGKNYNDMRRNGLKFVKI